MSRSVPDAIAELDEPVPTTSSLLNVRAFRDVLDAIDVRISVLDRDDVLVFQNRAEIEAYASIGIDPATLIGRKRMDINRLLVANGVIDDRSFDRLNGRKSRVHVSAFGRRTLSVRRFPLPDGGLVVVNTEETEVRRAEQINAEEQRLTTIGSLVAGIAHEINTPLGVAVTAASFLRGAVTRAQVALRTGALTPEEAERALGAIADASALILSNLDRSADLVRGFKALAAESTGDDRRRLRIRRHVTGVVATLAPEARSRGHVLLVDCPTDVEIETSSAALSQVLANLVLNSLRHAFEDRAGGTVLVSVMRLEGHLRIVVGDDGVGVAPDDHRRIFEPFYTTRRPQGLRGLGLSIVHNLVTRRLGGTIETEGCPGEGLRQIVTIPLLRSTSVPEPVRAGA